MRPAKACCTMCCLFWKVHLVNILWLITGEKAVSAQPSTMKVELGDLGCVVRKQNIRCVVPVAHLDVAWPDSEVGDVKYDDQRTSLIHAQIVVRQPLSSPAVCGRHESTRTCYQRCFLSCSQAIPESHMDCQQQQLSVRDLQVVPCQSPITFTLSLTASGTAVASCQVCPPGLHALRRIKLSSLCVQAHGAVERWTAAMQSASRISQVRTTTQVQIACRWIAPRADR